MVCQGLLLLALSGLALAHFMGSQGGWGWLRGAEAAAVGAIADWFAVVALFRHPLGLKTAHRHHSESQRPHRRRPWPSSSAITF